MSARLYGTRLRRACYIHDSALIWIMDSRLMETPTACILLVEDEPLVRADTIETLRAAGFQVIDASNADQAIAILETRSDIRVVVTDIQMPGTMHGLKLAAVIRNRWPPIALIVTSGRITVQADELPERGRFLSKPYSGAHLIEAIHASL